MVEPAAEDDVLSRLDTRNKATLKQKRSFFVRMVSDPKLYNPKIVKNIPRYKVSNESIQEVSEGISPL